MSVKAIPGNECVVGGEEKAKEDSQQQPPRELTTER